MGGSGSGRSAWRNVGTVEGRISLDVGHLRREGALRLGVVATWRWSWGAGSTASISSHAQAGSLVLTYSVNGAPRRELVQLEHLACHFGGSRPWFRCPRCQRRAGRLFFNSSGAFVCRKCARLAYRSQRADLCERGWMKIRKAYRALGLAPDEAELMEFVPKPKGMHWRTFDRHWRALEVGAEMRDHIELPASLLRLLERHR